MGIEIAIQFLENAVLGTTFAGSSWIMSLTIIVITLTIITREISDWGILLLPVLVGWKYFGMEVPLMFLITATIIFIITTVSTRVLSGALKTMGEGIIDLTKRLRTEPTLEEMRRKEEKGEIARAIRKYRTKRKIEVEIEQERSKEMKKRKKKLINKKEE